MVIELQPKSGDSNVPGAPADLHSLLGLDTLVVKKKIEMVEVVLGCETKNRYHIFDSQVSSAFNVVSHLSLLFLLIIGQRAF